MNHPPPNSIERRGQRLTIRSLRDEDEAALHEIAGRAEVSRTSTDIPHPIPDAYTREWLDRQAKRWASGECYGFAIVENDTDRVIGDTTLWIDDRNKRGTLGYILHPDIWGKGYATEAAQLTVDWGFEELGLVRIDADCFVWHYPSRRVLEKIGMRLEGILRARTEHAGIWHDDCQFGMTREMWEARRAGRDTSTDGARFGDALPRPIERIDLETDRLILECYAQSHVPEITEAINEPGISEYTRTIQYPYTEKDAQSFALRHEDGLESGTMVCWAIRERESGAVIGSIGFTINREDSNAEIGYMINSAFRGRGYATEAARACMQFGFETLRLFRIYASWYADNPASGKILRKLGMSEEGTLKGHSFRGGFQRDIVYMGLLRSEYDALSRSNGAFQ